MTAARLSLIAALIAAVALPASGMDLPWRERPEAAAPPPRPVVSEILSPHHDAGRIIPGHIAAGTEVRLGFQTLGRIIERSVALGDKVEAGAVLARLDPEDLDGEVRAAEAAVSAAEAQYETALLTAERTRQLTARNVTSTANLEQAENAMIAAEAAYLQAQSQLIRARDQQKFADITAPFDGVITQIWAEPGEVVEAGAPVITLSGTLKREAVIDVTEADIADLAPDDLWMVWQEVSPNERYPARLERISPLADTRTRTRRMRLALPPEAPFRLGAMIRANPGHRDTGALSVPQNAVLQDRETGGETAQVWVISRPAPDGNADHGIASLVSVTIASQSGSRLVIEGLPAGTEIVTRGIHSLTEGQIVAGRIAP